MDESKFQYKQPVYHQAQYGSSAAHDTSAPIYYATDVPYPQHPQPQQHQHHQYTSTAPQFSSHRKVRFASKRSRFSRSRSASKPSLYDFHHNHLHHHNNNNNNNASSHVDRRSLSGPRSSPHSPQSPKKQSVSTSNLKSAAAPPLKSLSFGARDGSHGTTNYSGSTPTMTPNSSMYHQPIANTMESAQTQSSLNLLPSIKYYSNQHSNNSNSTHISSGSNHSKTSSNSAFSHFTSSDVNINGNRNSHSHGGGGGGGGGGGHRTKLALKRGQSQRSHSQSDPPTMNTHTSMAVQFHQFESPISSTMATPPNPQSTFSPNPFQPHSPIQPLPEVEPYFHHHQSTNSNSTYQQIPTDFMMLTADTGDSNTTNNGVNAVNSGVIRTIDTDPQINAQSSPRPATSTVSTVRKRADSGYQRPLPRSSTGNINLLELDEATEDIASNSPLAMHTPSVLFGRHPPIYGASNSTQQLHPHHRQRHSGSVHSLHSPNHRVNKNHHHSLHGHHSNSASVLHTLATSSESKTSSQGHPTSNKQCTLHDFGGDIRAYNTWISCQSTVPTPTIFFYALYPKLVIYFMETVQSTRYPVQDELRPVLIRHGAIGHRYQNDPNMYLSIDRGQFLSFWSWFKHATLVLLELRYLWDLSSANNMNQNVNHQNLSDDNFPNGLGLDLFCQRDQCESNLLQSAEGTFMLRLSSRIPGGLVLSYVENVIASSDPSHKRECKHVILIRQSDGMYLCNKKTLSLHEIIRNFVKLKSLWTPHRPIPKNKILMF